LLKLGSLSSSLRDQGINGSLEMLANFDNPECVEYCQTLISYVEKTYGSSAVYYRDQSLSGSFGFFIRESGETMVVDVENRTVAVYTHDGGGLGLSPVPFDMVTSEGLIIN